METVNDSCGMPSACYLCLFSAMALTVIILTDNTTQSPRFLLVSDHP
jgi:hypothetical protein